MTTAAARKPIKRTPTRASAGPVLAVGSGKGGVGKTWLSVTLACLFARQGKRTLLVDGDLGLANADLQLGVRTEADLAAYMRGWVELKDAIAPVAGGSGRSGGFDLLAGSSGTGALADLKGEEVSLIGQGVAKLAYHYDRVVLDLAAGVDQSVIRLAKMADRFLVVTTEEPTAMTDAYALIKVTHAAVRSILPFIVVNQADKRLDGQRTYNQLAKACEQHLQLRPAFAGVIRRDPRVSDAIRAQTPLPLRHPGADALEDVVAIMEGLALG